MLETVNNPCASAMTYRHRGDFDRAELTVTYAVNWAQHEARIDAGIRAITDEFVLAALLSVPGDRVGVVDARFDKALRKSSGASLVTIISDPDGGIWAQRHVRPVVDVIGIDIQAPSLRRGCTVAQRWAGYGPRTVHASADASTFELTEAAHYGIGFVRDERVQLLRAETFVSKRWSSARWRFSELIYAQFLDLLG